MISNASNQTVICFGEVLWDMLPQGKMIGGAPLNVAYHLHKLGIDAPLVSRIGEDEYGKEIKAFIEKNGLPHAILQSDTHHLTGRVEVALQPNHEVRYEIVRDTAWDFIEYEDRIKELAQKAAYLVYGSLITRSKTSHDTLFRLMEHPLAKVMDVNLRAPFYSKDILEELIAKADIIKMNEAELQLISSWFGYTGNETERMKSLSDQFHLHICIVTCGSKGAYVLCENELFFEAGYQITVADTIGSGDAFLAGFLSSFINGVPLRQALKSANAMGAFIAQRRGGCPAYEKQEIQKMINYTFPTF